MLPVIIGAFLFLLLFLWMDPQSSNRAIYYIVPLTALIVFGTYTQIWSRQKWMVGAVTFGAFFALTAFLFATLYMSNSTTVLSGIRLVSPMYIPILLVLAAATVSPFLKIWTNRQTGLIQFLMSALLYLPCAIRDGIDQMRTEFKLVTSTTRLLLFLQLGIVLLYVVGPVVYQKGMNWWRGDFLYKELYRFRTATYPNTGAGQLNVGADKKTKGLVVKDAAYFKNHPQTNYTVSFWIYMNEDRNNPDSAPSGSSKYQVLNYGERPLIVVRHNQLSITNHGYDGEAAHVATIPLQKWVHVVLVYEKNKCNLFLDGEFHSTMKLRPIEKEKGDIFKGVVQIGDLTKHGNGGIRGLRAKMRPMTKTQILIEKDAAF